MKREITENVVEQRTRTVTICDGCGLEKSSTLTVARAPEIVPTRTMYAGEEYTVREMLDYGVELDTAGEIDLCDDCWQDLKIKRDDDA